MDRSAHRAQVARIVAASAGGEVLLQFLGKGPRFPATIARDNPKATRAQPDLGDLNLELVAIARAALDVDTGAPVFAGELPREGDHFVDAAGRRYRIQDDRTTSHSPLLLYACVASPAS